jgi:hypothetical protein
MNVTETAKQRKKREITDKEVERSNSNNSQ